MSFSVILTLLFCFGIQGSYLVEDRIYVKEDEYEYLDLEDVLDWNGFTESYPVTEDDDRMLAYKRLTDPQDWNGPLSSVKLIVDSVSNSSDSCKLSVTCNTFYFNISSTFTCDTKTCSQEGGEQRKTLEVASVSLHLYLSDGSIICNHSNQVDWTKDITKIRQFCPRNAGSKSLSDGISICTVKTVVFSVGLIIMVSAVISVHVIEKQSRTKQIFFSQPVEI